MSAPTTERERSFEARFEQELARGDARRAGVVAGVLGVAGGATCLAVAADTVAGRGENAGPALATALILLALAAVEAALWRHLRWRVGQRQPVSLGATLGALCLEVVAALGLVAIIAGMGQPLGALNGPGPLLIAGFLLASVLRLEPVVPLVGGVVGMVGYGALALAWLPAIRAAGADTFLAEDAGPYVLRALAFAVLGGTAALVAREIRARVSNALRATEERRRMLDLFSQQVSPEVVDKLLSQETPLDSELRSVCVMFLDIRGFTRFSEGRSPQEVVAYLNTLFDRFITVVNARGGIINKFLGDGFMALFGAPVSDGQDARNAVAAALELLAAVEALEAAGAIPPTKVGVGLHLGPVVVGNIGSRQRLEYTAIGDTVNTAARIEGLNKALGSEVLVSGVVREAAPGLCAGAEAVDPIEIRGKAAPVEIWRLR